MAGRTTRTGQRENTPNFSAAAEAYNLSLKQLGANDEEAFRLNAIAAESGMHDAILAMGWFFRNGIGVSSDDEAAAAWWTKSARQGDARAMFSLGQLAEEQADYAEAMTWFKRAAENGHSRSLYWIGKLYWRGRGVSENRKLARQFFEQAAQKKQVDAQRALRFLSFYSKLK
jgi:TPR repeat protein